MSLIVDGKRMEKERIDWGNSCRQVILLIFLSIVLNE